MGKRIDHNQVFDKDGNLISQEIVEVVTYPSEEESLKLAARLTVLPLLEGDLLKDEDAEQYAGLFPEWEVGIPVEAGWVYRWDGTIFRCIQPHTTQADWAPGPATASLWTGYRTAETLPWAQPPAENPYMIGDKVLWTDGNVYESTIDNNIWSPVGYPSGWSQVV